MSKPRGAAKSRAPPAPSRMTRSSTITTRSTALEAPVIDAKTADGAAKEADASMTKNREKKRKRDADAMEGTQVELDHDRLHQETSAKRVKSSKHNAPCLDPFPATPLPDHIPEPAMSVADHETHSNNVARLLASTAPDSLSSLESDGKSPFQISLSVKEKADRRELTTPPNPSSPKLPAAKVPLSTSSKPPSTRPALALPPLPASNMPKKSNPTPRSSVAPQPRPFLVLRADKPTSSVFSTSSSSKSAEPLAPVPEKQSTPAPKATKQVAHLISELTGRVERLERESKVLLQTGVKLKAQCEDLKKENTDLIKQTETMDSALWELRDEMDEQKALTASILAAIDGLKSGAGAGDVGLAAKKVEKTKNNNAYNTATRKAFLTMMGITNTTQIGTLVPLGPNEYFLLEDGESTPKLRPDWNSKFAQNAAWHAQVVKFFRAKCHQLHAPCTKEDIAERTDSELIKKIGDHFKRMQKTYINSKPSPEIDRAKAAQRKWARQYQRKTKKAESRQDIRMESGLTDPEWDALFEITYQSTDETDYEDTIDPGTDTSATDEPKVSSGGRDWITRPPNYRSVTVAAAVTRLNALVQERRDEEGKTKTHKSRHLVHGRKLGDTREKPLPLPGRAKAISLSLVDPEWLATHPESRNACYIDGYTKEEPEDDVGFEGGGEDGEDGEDCGQDQSEDEHDEGLTKEGLYTMDQCGDDDDEFEGLYLDAQVPIHS